METRLLEYFLTVSREKNITKAANYLHITQPTLSRQLTTLEEEVGKQLLIRSKKGIQLTEEGILFRRRAEEIIELVQKTEKELSDIKDHISGELFIGLPECEASFVMIPNILKEFHEDYPEVTFHLYTGEAQLIIEKIDQGLLDIGILLDPIDITELNFLRLPQKETIGLIVPKDDPLSYKDYIEPQDLIDKNIFMNGKRTTVYNEINALVEDFTCLVSHNLIGNTLPLVRNHLGYALTIESMVLHQDDLTFIPLKPHMEFGTILAWPKNKTLTPLTKTFITYIENEL